MIQRNAQRRVGLGQTLAATARLAQSRTDFRIRIAFSGRPLGQPLPEPLHFEGHVHIDLPLRLDKVIAFHPAATQWILAMPQLFYVLHRVSPPLLRYHSIQG